MPILLLLLCLVAPVSFAQQQPFVLSNVEVKGLVRVDIGLVFSALDIEIGQEITSKDISRNIKNLFNTERFQGVQVIKKDKGILFQVTEQPIVGSLEIEGNSLLKDEQLLKALHNQGVYAGAIYYKGIVHSIVRAIRNQYIGQGYYGISVQERTEELSRNRIAVYIDVREGDPSAIKSIHFVGNTLFTHSQLLENFELQETGYLSFLNDGDKYSKEIFSADIERLESFYRDQGYLQARVLEVDVQISPHSSDLFLRVDLVEGERYIFGKTSLLGDIIVPRHELEEMIENIKQGELYSQAQVFAVIQNIQDRLANDGYMFAKVEGVPQIRKDNVADIIFYVKPQAQIYIRRINFEGNSRTADHVLRRELRQLESAPASRTALQRGKYLIQQLKNIKEVDFELLSVSDAADQLDATYRIEEQSSGQVQFSLAYDDSTGFVPSIALQENNFLGEGDDIDLRFQRGTTSSIYSINYNKPYLTPEGVSLGVITSISQLDNSRLNIAQYASEQNRLGTTIAYPLTDFDRLSFSLSLDNIHVIEGSSPNVEISEFFLAHGEKFFLAPIRLSWTHSSLNRGIFPTEGSFHFLSLETNLPGSDLEYGSVSYRFSHYIPLHKDTSLVFTGDFVYGDSLSSDGRYPFFKNYFAGGLGTVRGFKTSILGPRESSSGNTVGNVIGGNIRIVSSVRLIFPLPFLKDQSGIQASLFADAGNIFDSNCGDNQKLCYNVDFEELRYSYGLSFSWLSPAGPISMSYAKASGGNEDEELEAFQFSVGRLF